ncbi:MAG: nucleotidyltransferase [Opitutaceae bacterium]|nr:nucleotidyltransferase [Opitutaceae bacterium]
MAPTLLVLAAGQGSRYGGLKQMDPVGPSEETLLDYAVFDAQRAGFGRVVFVIRQDFAAAFREKIGARYAGRIAVDYVLQATSARPAGCVPRLGREKPWGTAHAVWCARDLIREPFAVINADDFYGADSYLQLAQFLAGTARAPQQAPRFAMAAFRLAATLSTHGTVSRGICLTDTHGRLVSLTEHTAIAAADVGPGRAFTGNEIVSMNCWGFTPEIFTALDSQLRDFLAASGGDPKAELYLPSAVAVMLANGGATVDVLPVAGAWFGVTHREDKPRVQAALAGLVRAGNYPAKLL